MAWEEVVALGGGALGAAVEADMRSGAGGRGASREGAGAYLVGRGGDRRAENEEVESESNEEARASVADAARRGVAACVDKAQFGGGGTLRLDAAQEACRRAVVRTGCGGAWCSW